ncbi:MAG: hypothetical protein QM698_16390 [Micropepsaceae bacterium]
MTIRKAFLGVAAAAALLTSGSAYAGALGPGNHLNDLRNGWQINWATAYSHLNFTGWMIGGDLRASSTSIGNNFTASTEGSTFLQNQQMQLADVGASVNVDVHKVKGDVDISATGVCNNAGLTTSGGYGSAYNDQRCGTIDPFAVADVKLGFVAGDTSIAATAIANNMTMDVTNGAVVLNQDRQVNVSGTYARVTADIGATAGNVDISATSVGNNISINQRFGTP